jgi:hypothetical protein
MGNACNFAKDEEELEFEKQMSTRKDPRLRDNNSQCDSIVSFAKLTKLDDACKKPDEIR